MTYEEAIAELNKEAEDPQDEEMEEALVVLRSPGFKKKGGSLRKKKLFDTLSKEGTSIKKEKESKPIKYSNVQSINKTIKQFHIVYSDKIRRAIKFASKTHNQYQQQNRKGKVIPYITHPLTVGIILSLAKASEDVIIAGILHDTIEDSPEHKKVTPEMITERFGKNVVKLVLSVTEKNRNLSWEERKKEALRHIKDFSNDSLLVKSADVLANYSELVDDHNRYGDEVFNRFNGSKEEIIVHQLKIISAVLTKWPENPLYWDLKLLACDLEGICSEEFREKYPAKIIKIKNFKNIMKIKCPICGWRGTPESGSSGWDSDFCLDVVCPICGKMILVAEYALTNYKPE
ncbi:MAG: HD domain-containing protein [Patescibacteria group bacterium]|jgi:hypothetical protein